MGPDPKTQANVQSIADRTRVNPAIDPSAFPNTPSDWFWSASPYVGASGYAWYATPARGKAVGATNEAAAP
jgi:hypothetical protein